MRHIEIRLEAEDGVSTLSNPTWDAIIDTRNGRASYAVPAGRTIVGWESSWRDYNGNKFAAGFKLILDDGHEETMGPFYSPWLTTEYPVRNIQHIRGPIRGVDFLIGNENHHTVHAIFVYDECACDSTFSPSSAT